MGLARRELLIGAMALPFAAVPSFRAFAQGAEYARPSRLVPPEWLAPRLTDPQTRVVFVGPAEVFEAGHIPGSVLIAPEALDLPDSSEETVRAWRSDMLARLGSIGISTSSRVVIYDDGTLFASRLWWLLDYLGHRDSRILNGGFPAWYTAGFDVVTGDAGAIATDYGSPQVHESRLARVERVKDVLDDPRILIIDARRTTAYSDAHIPGAVNVPRYENAVRGPIKYWRSAEELNATYAAAGLTLDTPVIAYSEEGLRSSSTYFTLRLLGVKHVALYSPSWREWSHDPSLPIESSGEKD